LGYTDKQKNDIIHEIFCKSVEYDNTKRLQHNRLMGAMNPIVSALATGMPVRPLYSFCYAHENTLTVDPYGNFYTCLITVGREGLEAGTYYPYITYKENAIRNRNIDKIPECKECIYSLLCGGGCPIRLKDHSDYFKPVCTSTKTQIHELLPRLYKTERAQKEKMAKEKA